MSKNMCPKKFPRSQLRFADIHDSDDTLHTAASIAQRATTAVLPGAEIDDDDDLDNDLGDQGDEDSLIDNDIGDLCSRITDEDRVDLATRNRLMLEMMLENRALCNPE